MAARQTSNHKEGKSLNGKRRAPSQQRPALVSLHPNTRLVPDGAPMARLTRSRSDALDQPPHELGASSGVKRKRPATNATRSAGSLKKRKPASPEPASEPEDAGDEQATDAEHESDDVGEESDEFLLNHAPRWRLQKLLKEDLIRLCALAELDDADDLEAHNKSDIVQRILATRPTRSSSQHSTRTSSRGDVTEPEDEANDIHETPRAGPSNRKRPRTLQLGRRQTENFASPTKQPRGMATSRSVSLGNLNAHLPLKSLPIRARRTSAQSEQHRSTTSHLLAPPITAIVPSPRKTRSRARLQAFASKLKSLGSSKSTASTSRSSRSSRSRSNEVEDEEEDDEELTELDEDEDEVEPSPVKPSPRRLRRRRDGQSVGGSSTASRVPPKRKARFEGSMRESSTEAEDDEEDELAHGEEEEEEEEGEDELEAESEEDDADAQDELVSEMDVDERAAAKRRGKRSIPPPPTKRSLRRRATQAHTPPSDEEAEEEGDAEEEDEAEEEPAEEESAEEVVEEPKVLRNGKILGDSQDFFEEEEEEEEEDGAASEDIEDSSFEQEGSSMEVEIDQLDEEESGMDDIAEEDEHQGSEDEIDIESANLKTLLRHKRDDLVRLCEANDIETDGVRTKNQLAHALLQWRDSTAQFPSSPTERSVSSQGTERGDIRTKRPLPNRHGGGGARSSALMPPPAITPLLYRDQDNVHHADVPATPPISGKANERLQEDVELDLESLGLTDKEIKPEKIQKLEKIGSGGFKDVFLGKYHGRKVAIAEFRGQLSAMDIKELKLLREFSHPNVVKFYGVSIPADTRSTPVMIISELCPNGDLFDFIRNTAPLSLRGVLNLMHDIARGIEYLHLHTPSIIHRDCKSSNILITAKNTAKITDFGLAKVKQSTRSMVRSLVGTVNWQAPELWHPQPKYDHKVDVFSCAMVYWEMLQWHQARKMYPWEGMNEHAIYDVVGRKNQRPSMHGMRKLWCPEIVELIERMWEQDPRDRPTISEVVQDLEVIISNH